MFNPLNQVSSLFTPALEPNEEDEADNEVDHLRAKVLEFEKALQDKNKLIEHQQVQLNKLNLQNKVKRVQLNKLKSSHEGKEELPQENEASVTHGKLLIAKKQLEECQQELATAKHHVTHLENQYQELFNSQKSSNTDSKNKNTIVTDAQEMYAQMVYKDTKILELNNKILEQERLMMDLKEHINEKDEVLSVRDKAIQLMTENLSLRGKSTMDELEETKLHMKDMQESFADMEIEWKVKEQKLKDELVSKMEDINQLKRGLQSFEDSNYISRNNLTELVKPLGEIIPTINKEDTAIEDNQQTGPQLADVIENNFCNEECRKLKVTIEALAGHSLTHDTCIDFITQVLNQKQRPDQKTYSSGLQPQMVEDNSTETINNLNSELKETTKVIETLNSELLLLKADSSKEMTDNQSIIDNLINQIDSLNFQVLSEQEENRNLLWTNSELKLTMKSIEDERETLKLATQDVTIIKSELALKNEQLVAALDEIEDNQLKIDILIESQKKCDETDAKIGFKQEYFDSFRNNLKTSLQLLRSDSQSLRRVLKEETSYFQEEFVSLANYVDKYKQDSETSRRSLLKELNQLIELIVDESMHQHLLNLLNEAEDDKSLSDLKLQTFILAFSAAVGERLKTPDERLEYFEKSQQELESINSLQKARIGELSMQLQESYCKLKSVHEESNQVLSLEKQILSQKLKEMAAVLTEVQGLKDRMSTFESCSGRDLLKDLKQLELEANILNKQVKDFKKDLSSIDFTSLEKSFKELGMEKEQHQKELEDILSNKLKEEEIVEVSQSLKLLNMSFQAISHQVRELSDKKDNDDKEFVRKLISAKELEKEVSKLSNCLSANYGIVKKHVLDVEDLTLEEIMKELPKELEQLVDVRDTQKVLEERIRHLEDIASDYMTVTDKLKGDYNQAKTTIKTLNKECNELKHQLLEVTPLPQIEEDYNQLQTNFKQLNLEYKELKFQYETLLRNFESEVIPQQDSAKQFQLLQQSKSLSSKNLEELEHHLAVQKQKFEKVLLKCKALKDENKQLQQANVKNVQVEVEKEETFNAEIVEKDNEILALKQEATKTENLFQRQLANLRNELEQSQDLIMALNIKINVSKADFNKCLEELEHSQLESRKIKDELKTISQYLQEAKVQKLTLGEEAMGLKQHYLEIENKNNTLVKQMKDLQEHSRMISNDNSMFQTLCTDLQASKDAVEKELLQLKKNDAVNYMDYQNTIRDLEEKIVELMSKSTAIIRRKSEINELLEKVNDLPFESEEVKSKDIALNNVDNDDFDSKDTRQILADKEDKIKQLLYSNQEQTYSIELLELKVRDFEVREKLVQSQLLRNISTENVYKQNLDDQQEKIKEYEEQLATAVKQNQKYLEEIDQVRALAMQSNKSFSRDVETVEDHQEFKGFNPQTTESRFLSVVNLEGSAILEKDNFMPNPSNEATFLSKSPEECCLMMEDLPEKPSEESGLLSFSARSLLPQRWWPRNNRLF